LKYASLVLRSLFRHRLRTTLTLSFLALSVFLVALMQGFLGTIDALTTSSASGSRLVVQDKASFTNVIPESYGNFLRAQSEVEAVTQFQWFGGEYKDPKNFFANFAVQKDTYLKVYREEAGLDSLPPEQVRDFLMDGNGCIVGQSLADKYGWKVGDVIPLQSPIFNMSVRLTVRAVFKGKRQSDEQALVFDLKQIQEAVPWMKGRVGSFVVRVKNAKDIPKLCERIDRNFANASPETLSMSENAFNLNMMKMFGDFGTMLHSITSAVLVAILLVTASTMAMTIRERSTQIAVMRALGFTTGKVLGLLLAEGFLLALLGSILGLGMAVLTAKVTAGLASAILPWMADFYIQPDTLLLCAAGTLALGLVSTFVPAYQASRKPIVEALRAL
jgi:putative ABC transport system permease protein